MYHVGVSAHLIQPSGFATCIFPQEATLRLRQAFYELPENVKEFYEEKTIHSGKKQNLKLYLITLQNSIQRWTMMQ